MTIPASQDPSLGFVPGDHVCAFYTGSWNVLDDIVVDYVTRGLAGGNKVFCMVDDPAAVRDRIVPQLIARDDMLDVVTEDEAYVPDGHFSKDPFIARMRAKVIEAFDHGYEGVRAVGDVTFAIRHSIDMTEWFAAESELNTIVPDYPHFLFCLYDLDLFDGAAVMRVLQTHPRVYLNGILIDNPHYIAQPLPG
jgi:hypothetical protein